MPQAAAAAAIDYVEVAALDALAASAAASASYTALQVALTVAATYASYDQQRRAAAAQRDAYNASLRDRYAMMRATTAPRTLVLGRQRVSGPPFFMASYGDDRENLVLCVPLAGHEIDAVEAVYFNDEQLVLDASGYVLNVLRREQFSINTASATYTLTTEPGTVTAVVDYGSTQVALGVTVAGFDVTVTGATAGQPGTVTISYQPLVSPFENTASHEAVVDMTLDTAGGGSIGLPADYVVGSARVTYVYGEGADDATPWASVVGSTLTVASFPVPSVLVKVSYQVRTGAATLCRVQAYLGAPGQAADPDMVANLPGIWTSAHTATGVAYLKVECTYNTTAFPTGVPQVSATVRGAKVYHPSTGLTAWSENAALLLRHAATSPLCGRLDASLLDDTSFLVAGNVCGTLATYNVNGQAYTRPQYTAGLVHRADTRPQDTLNDLAQAMCGRWVFSYGQLVVRAGAWSTPLQTITPEWLSDAQPVSIQPAAGRAELFNVVTGSFVDEQRDFRVVPYPRVEGAAYITADGAELPLAMALNAVTFVGQAQQVSAVAMRDARQGLRVTLACRMHAFATQVFDFVKVTLPRYGWDEKVFEVLDRSWTFGGQIQLHLKESDPSIWALGTSFAAQDPAPNTRLPSPSEVPEVTGLACASGTAHLIRQPDGTILSRLRVSWVAITDPAVLGSGGIEVRYGQAGTAESQWESRFVSGDQAGTYITAVRDGQVYSVKARAYNTLARGHWCLPVAHKVVGKTAAPNPVTGLAAAVVPGAVRISLTPPADVDLGSIVLKHGASFAAGTLIADIGTASVHNWAYPALGSYTVWAVAYDTSGNPSTAASTTVTVTAAALDPALTAVGTIQSDNILSRGEKPALIKEWGSIADEKAGIDATAAAAFVTTELTAYGSAYTALASYLGGLSPAWNDATQDTPITPATDQAAWASFYAARQALLNRIAANVGPVTSGAAITATKTVISGAASAAVTFNATGVISWKTGAINRTAPWYLPFTGNPGAGHYITVTQVSGSAPAAGSPAIGSAVSLASSPAWTWTAAALGTVAASCTFAISTDASGNDVVATGAFNVSATWANPA